MHKGERADKPRDAKTDIWQASQMSVPDDVTLLEDPGLKNYHRKNIWNRSKQVTIKFAFKPYI